MNKTSIYYFSLAAIAIGSLASCQDYEPFDEATVREAAVKKEFSKNFEARYGKIDPNHTWGFHEIKSFSGGPITRAGDIDRNRNQWVERNTDGTYKDGALITHVSVPGYPNFDGYYYLRGSGDLKGDIVATEPVPNFGGEPVGDVTDYEVQYVSRWFREHPDPTPSPLHVSSFYVMNISSDYDRQSYPDGAIVENQLGRNCNYGMDQLLFKTLESTDDYATWTHLLDYNANATNQMHSDGVIETKTTIDNGGKLFASDKTQHRLIQYVRSSGTESFAYRGTFSTEETTTNYFDKWVLVHLDWDEVGQDGKTYHRDGYYLAFDYQAKVGDQKYSGDDYYSNWIIKIAPAFTSELNPNEVRIMCEDLGNTYDFDFNDIVYDVKYETVGTSTNAVITLKAAGGTLPIYVGFDPSVGDNASKYEAHRLLGGKSSKTPLNVGGEKGSPAIVNLNGVSSTDPDNIPVYVINGGTTYTIGPSSVSNIKKNDENTYNKEDKSTSLTPQKFSVPNNVRWMKETEQIEDAYPCFKNWVCDALYTDEGKPWYHNDLINATNASLIYESGDSGYSGSNSNSGSGSGTGTGGSSNYTLHNNPSGQEVNLQDFGLYDPNVRPAVETALNAGCTTIVIELKDNLSSNTTYKVEQAQGSIVVTESLAAGSSVYEIAIPESILSSKKGDFLISFDPKLQGVTKIYLKK